MRINSKRAEFWTHKLVMAVLKELEHLGAIAEGVGENVCFMDGHPAGDGNLKLTVKLHSEERAIQIALAMQLLGYPNWSRWSEGLEQGRAPIGSVGVIVGTWKGMFYADATPNGIQLNF